MPTSHSYRDLFRQPSTVDKLNFFQSLVDSKDLIPDLALAFINIIRAELEQPQKQSASAYRCYSQVITSLCVQMPEVYEPVLSAWQQRQREAASPHSPQSTPQEPELPQTGNEEPTPVGVG